MMERHGGTKPVYLMAAGKLNREIEPEKKGPRTRYVFQGHNSIDHPDTPRSVIYYYYSSRKSSLLVKLNHHSNLKR